MLENGREVHVERITIGTGTVRVHARGTYSGGRTRKEATIYHGSKRRALPPMEQGS